MSKPVCRIGDADVTHDCNPLYRAEGSHNVYVNGIGISREGDINTVHKFGALCLSTHAQPIEKGSRSVFINDKGCGRIGDKISGCTEVAEGSHNVFAGD